jgi:hypothetical protein
MYNLSYWSNVSQIVTGIIAIVSIGSFVLSREFRKCKLEIYLRTVSKSDAKRKKAGLRSVLHLMAVLGMTEEQLFQASFRSSHIRRGPKKGHEGLATNILFGYID